MRILYFTIDPIIYPLIKCFQFNISLLLKSFLIQIKHYLDIWRGLNFEKELNLGFYKLKGLLTLHRHSKIEYQVFMPCFQQLSAQWNKSTLALKRL